MKPRRYPTSHPFLFWERPTQAQFDEGILAILIECHDMPTNDGRRIPYEQATPYRADSLLRRYKRTGELPRFISVADATVKD